MLQKGRGLVGRTVDSQGQRIGLKRAYEGLSSKVRGPLILRGGGPLSAKTAEAGVTIQRIGLPRYKYS